MCQCHGSKFDLTSGAVLRAPATDPLATCEVRETNDEIRIRA
jgi:nitrite reductase/ring-hydroxylating ferredoxin subunit